MLLNHKNHSIDELPLSDIGLLLEAAAKILVDPHAPLVFKVNRHQRLARLEWTENVE